ncbi:sigma factor-like helix-turn-helix DNA-binding protein [Leifsonia sp. ALI-44-B]|uniref:RNA polymerase sigma factor n=1 Tax=Leifsonia sp. ALI-44-B TaxID=1933776 RepID=UPI0009FA2DEA
MAFKLKPDDAELIRLIYWDGFHSHEAAIVLGVSASAARSRLSKARATLRAELKVELDEPTAHRGPAVGGNAL